MKKLFISCPMRGRTEENIKKSMEKMHKLAEIIFDQELEVIPTYIEDNPPEDTRHSRVWYLGESIKKLSEADYFIGIEWAGFYNGCNVESHVAECYDIPKYLINAYQFMPDVDEIVTKHYAQQSEVCPKNC